MNDRNWGGKRAGAGRKRTGINYVTLALALPEEDAIELKKRAKEMDMSVSLFVRKFLLLSK